MTTALYRRYRPEAFADVIGQEHVTEPLMAAISANRASHAYLFSGPRGCGKTTSARILARCLNCEHGPTPTPCGTCPSCVELARGGSGSLDVVEIDAASHNGVDDARELRERAAFAPARDRYKIFILDEAHMVTSQGFNALLKLVEEPPPHVKFVFATTEPEKVISTIRSRTHHYPFRLVPPDRLQDYLERICTAEGVEVGSGVLPLVVRAGGGSVRDSLSVLDQLIAGADGNLDYAQAVALLGYTPATLLDDVVEALEAADGASVFRVVDRVIESGHDPRRFVEDLLQRLRDLVVIVAAGERAADVLRGVPQDQFERMLSQANRLGLAQLSRAADLTMATLTEMTGATSPRLQLELLCARLLLPAADEPVRGYGARIERLEKRVDSGTTPPAPARPAEAREVARPAPAPAATAPEPEPAQAPEAEAARAQADAAPAAEEAAAPAAEARRAPSPQRPSPRAEPAEQRRSAPRSSAPASSPPPADSPAAVSPPAPARGDEDEVASAGVDTETIRRRWPEVLDTLSRIRRVTWTLTSQNAQVVGLSGRVLRLRFDTPGIAGAFRNGQHADAVERALRETLGVAAKIEAVTDADPAEPARGRGAAGPAEPSSEPVAEPDHAARAAADWAQPPGPRAESSPPRQARGSGTQRAAEGGQAPSAHADAEGDAAGSGASAPSSDDQEGSQPSQRGTVRPARSSWRDHIPAEAPPAAEPVPQDWEPSPEDEQDANDPDLDASPLVGAQLVQRVFGATVIDEIPVDPSGSAPRGGS